MMLLVSRVSSSQAERRLSSGELELMHESSRCTKREPRTQTMIRTEAGEMMRT